MVEETRLLIHVPPALIGGFCAALGAVVGSFLNVVIARVPEGRSVVRPPSACPSCGSGIRARDNIPVLSWILLRGRCRACGWAIPVRYPAVETITALLFLLVYFKVLPQLGTSDAHFVMGVTHGAVFLAGLFAVAAIDLDCFIIPDPLSLGGTVVGLLLAFVAGAATGVDWRSSALGAVSGGGLLLLVAWGYRIVRGREGMGMGDVKLLAAIGAFLGLQAIPFVLLMAALQGILVALLWVAFGERQELPEDIVEMTRLPQSDEDSERPADIASDGAPDGPASEDEPAEGDAEDEEAERSLASTVVPFGPFLALAAMEWYLLHDVLADWIPY